jgi:hypothetical protein
MQIIVKRDVDERKAASPVFPEPDPIIQEILNSGHHPTTPQPVEFG